MNRAVIVAGVFTGLTAADWVLALLLKDTSFLGNRLENIVAAAVIAWAWEGRRK